MAMQRFVRLDKRMLKKCMSLIRAAFRTNGPEYHAKRLAWYSGPFVRKAALSFRELFIFSVFWGSSINGTENTRRALLSKEPYIESYATLLIKACQVMLGFFLESEAGGGKRKELSSHLSCSLERGSLLSCFDRLSGS